MSDCIGIRKKKSHKPSVLRAIWVKLSEWNSRQSLSKAAPLQNKLPRCSVYKRWRGRKCSVRRSTISVWWALVSAGGWWSAVVICCRSTGPEHHHTARGRVSSPRRLSQGRTNFLPSFGVHPFLSPVLNVFLEMPSRIAESTARRLRNEGQLFLHVFTPFGDILLHSNTHTHAQHRF